MRTFLDRRCRGNQNTHFVFNNFFEYRAVYEIISKNMVEPERPQMTLQFGAYELHACMLDKQGYIRARACIRIRALE